MSEAQRVPGVSRSRPAPRRRARRPRRCIVYEERSPISGRIRVVDVGTERQLVVGGAILSALPRDGDWRLVRREYWWHALDAVVIPPRPAVLFVGLGGGTQLHLLHARTQPRRVTVIEHDPVILRIARRCFGLDAIPHVEFLCGEAQTIVPGLVRARRRYDFVMEDCTYGETSERSIPLAEALARLLRPGGVIVVNRHRRDHASETADALERIGVRVRLRHVRREAENVLVCGTRPPGERRKRM